MRLPTPLPASAVLMWLCAICTLTNGACLFTLPTPPIPQCACACAYVPVCLVCLWTDGVSPLLPGSLLRLLDSTLVVRVYIAQYRLACCSKSGHFYLPCMGTVSTPLMRAFHSNLQGQILIAFIHCLCPRICNPFIWLPWFGSPPHYARNGQSVCLYGTVALAHTHVHSMLQRD